MQLGQMIGQVPEGKVLNLVFTQGGVLVSHSEELEGGGRGDKQMDDMPGHEPDATSADATEEEAAKKKRKKNKKKRSSKGKKCY